MCNLALGAAYLAAARAAVHGVWALDETIGGTPVPPWLASIPEALSAFAKALLVSAGYLPLYGLASLALLAIVLSCLHGWIEAEDAGRRDPLSAFGALLALCGYGFVLHGLAGPA